MIKLKGGYLSLVKESWSNDSLDGQRRRALAPRSKTQQSAGVEDGQGGGIAVAGVEETDN